MDREYKVTDDTVPEDVPLRSDGSQQVLKKNWGSFRVQMVFRTWPLKCLVADVTMQEKKIWQNYSGSLACKKYEHRKKRNHERWNQSTAHWHPSHHQFEMDWCHSEDHYSGPEKRKWNSVFFVVKKEMAKTILGYNVDSDWIMTIRALIWWLSKLQLRMKKKRRLTDVMVKFSLKSTQQVSKICCLCLESGNIKEENIFEVYDLGNRN